MNKSHLFLVAAIVQGTSADPCQDLCAAHPDLCGTEGSFCMGGEDDECFDLYWTDGTRRFLTNATKNQCRLDYPLRCRDARQYITNGGTVTASGSSGRVAPLNFADVHVDPLFFEAPGTDELDMFADLLADMPQVSDLVARPSSRTSSKRASDGSDTDGEDGPIVAKKRARPSSRQGQASSPIDLVSAEAVGVEDRAPTMDPATADDLAAIASLLTLRRPESTQTLPLGSLSADSKVAQEDDFVLIDFGADKENTVSEAPAPKPSGHVLGRSQGSSRHLSSLARWRMANQGRPPTPKLVHLDPHYFNPVKEHGSSADMPWTDAEIDRVFSGAGQTASDADWSAYLDHDFAGTWELMETEPGADALPQHQLLTTRRRIVPVVHRRGTPGDRGVSNLGFTCYFGATLQLLSHSRRFREFLDSHPSVHPNALETQLRAFMARMWAPENEEGVIRPVEVFQALSAVNADEFVVGRMSDAHEALMTILDQLAESLKPADAPFHARTSLDSVFAIQDTQRSSCTACGHVSGTQVPAFEMFLNIPAVGRPQPSATVATVTSESTGFGAEDIFSMDEAVTLLGMGGGDATVTEKAGPQPTVRVATPEPYVTLRDCFAAYATEETIPEYACERCAPTRHDAHQVHRITNTSDIITVALRRFTWEDMKISTAVEIPMQLNMSQVPGSEVDGLYRLVGVVNHFGETRNGGHYTAMVFNSAENRWMNMDDSVAQLAPEFATQEAFRSTHAYILMYERVDAAAAVAVEAVEESVETTPEPTSDNTTTL